MRQGELLTSTEVCDQAGITYRQLDYWTRLEAVTDEAGAKGSGSRRRWTRRQAAVLAVLAKLVALGSRPSQLSEVTAVLMDLPTGDWPTTTLYVGLDGRVGVAPPAVAGQYVQLCGYDPGD